jgi:hypothetical protein
VRAAAAVLIAGLATYAANAALLALEESMMYAAVQEPFHTLLGINLGRYLVVGGMLLLFGGPVVIIATLLLKAFGHDRLLSFVLLFQLLFVAPSIAIKLLYTPSPTFSGSIGPCLAIDKGVTTSCGWQLFLVGELHYILLATIAALVFHPIYRLHRP